MDVSARGFVMNTVIRTRMVVFSQRGMRTLVCCTFLHAEGGYRLRWAGMNESTMNLSWLDDAKQDIEQWSASMPNDADNQPIDWRWVSSLDLRNGIGAATRQHVDLLAMLRSSSPQLSAPQLHALLKDDLAIRDRLEPTIAQCNSTFMMDYDRLIASYRLPRALAYANRRLCDEIAVLRQIGVAMGLWTVTEERRERVTVPVLLPGSALASGGVSLDDIQDRTADIVNGRAARRAAEKSQKRASDYAMSRANLSGVTNPGGSTLFDYGSETKSAESAQLRRMAEYRKSDWRDAYLPGRDVDNVMGIDIETTGTDPARVYIIDVGFEYMNMISPRPAAAPTGYQYEQSYYETGDAYGQSRLSFGVPAENATLGNPLILDLTGIDVRDRASGFRLFDEWPEAQIGLLQRLEQQPYVAHNARFEHSFFMLNVAGYAESYRAGKITIIDTLPMSRRWDEGSIPDASIRTAITRWTHTPSGRARSMKASRSATSVWKIRISCWLHETSLGCIAWRRPRSVGCEWQVWHRWQALRAPLVAFAIRVAVSWFFFP